MSLVLNSFGDRLSRGTKLVGDRLSRGTKLVGDHLSRGTKFLGTICPGGLEVRGTRDRMSKRTRCLGTGCGGPEVRGSNGIGTDCVAARNKVSTFNGFILTSQFSLFLARARTILGPKPSGKS